MILNLRKKVFTKRTRDHDNEFKRSDFDFDPTPTGGLILLIKFRDEASLPDYSNRFYPSNL